MTVCTQICTIDTREGFRIPSNLNETYKKTIFFSGVKASYPVKNAYNETKNTQNHFHLLVISYVFCKCISHFTIIIKIIKNKSSWFLIRLTVSDCVCALL